MVNRILIRIKVVQMLYAYLLTRRDFKIERAPLKDTADARYAHWLYINLLLMVMELTGHSARRDGQRTAPELLGEANVLASSKAGAALADDAILRDIIAAGTSGIDTFDNLLQRLYDRILASSLYQDIRKRKRINLEDNVHFWSVILQTTIASDPQFLQTARRTPGFTAVGYREAFDMAVSTLTDLGDARFSLRSAQKQLRTSLEMAYHLYMSLLQLPVYLTRLERERLEEAKRKYLATPQDLNPNLRLVDNRLVAKLADDPELQKYAKSEPAEWDSNYYLLRDLLDKIKDSDLYREYMEAPDDTFADDCEFWRKAFLLIIFPSDVLAEAMESMSVFWNDDLSIMGTFVLKTIRQISQAPETAPVPLLPMFKDEEDEKFGPDLFMDVVENRDIYRPYIDRFVKGDQWDPERTTFMDIVILLAAIAEIVNFPSIPVPVSVNEYVEIANYYSTPRSGQFVNGILFSIVNYLRSQGILTKL